MVKGLWADKAESLATSRASRRTPLHQLFPDFPDPKRRWHTVRGLTYTLVTAGRARSGRNAAVGSFGMA